jgi:hypothetical protein
MTIHLQYHRPFYPVPCWLVAWFAVAATSISVTFHQRHEAFFTGGGGVPGLGLFRPSTDGGCGSMTALCSVTASGLFACQ